MFERLNLFVLGVALTRGIVFFANAPRKETKRKPPIKISK
jgi:hypothetical protein